MNNKKIVMFDFDGVLVNTLDFSFYIHKRDNKNFTWKKFQNLNTGNFIDKMKEIVEKESHIIPDDFDKKYQEKIKILKIEDILNKTIQVLSENYYLIIISSTNSNYINSFLKKENLREYFIDILGSDIYGNKAEKINNTLKKYSILPKNAVFVTDSLGDILEANTCKIKSIAVTWGIHKREDLKKGNPIKIIDDPRDLLITIQNVLK